MSDTFHQLRTADGGALTQALEKLYAEERRLTGVVVRLERLEANAKKAAIQKADNRCVVAHHALVCKAVAVQKQALNLYRCEIPHVEKMADLEARLVLLERLYDSLKLKGVTK